MLDTLTMGLETMRRVGHRPRCPLRKGATLARQDPRSSVGSTAAHAYHRAAATAAEVDAYKARNHGHHPTVYRVVCNRCGKRLWGSGIGIGAHNRACRQGGNK